MAWEKQKIQLIEAAIDAETKNELVGINIGIMQSYEKDNFILKIDKVFEFLDINLNIDHQKI